MRLWAVLLAFCFAASFARADGQQLPGAERLGAISGTVSDATDRSALGGSIVQLGQPGTPARRVVADDQGRFVFASLAAGTYNLTASRLGYADGHFGPPSAATPLGSAIALGAGEWIRDGDVLLSRLAGISGTVTDETGQPLAGVFVRALKRLELGGRQELAAGPVATTDDLGRYRLASLPSGEYLVEIPSVERTMPASASMADVEGVAPDVLRALDSQARRFGAEPVRRAQAALRVGQFELMVGPYLLPPRASNGALQAYAVTFYPGTSEPSGAVPIEVGPGLDREGIDFVLQPTAGHRLAGVVKTDGTNPAGMVLRLMPRGLDHLGTGSEAATTRVAPDGTFVFLNVPSGEYLLTAPGATSEFAVRQQLSQPRAAGLPGTPGVGRSGSGATGGLVTIAPDVVYNALTPKSIEDVHAGSGQMPLTVAAGDVADVIFQLSATGAVRGRVVVDGNPDPAVGTLELAPAEPDPSKPVHTALVDLKSARTATFEMPVVVPGEYVVRSIGLPLTMESVVADGEDYSRRPLVVSSGADTDVTVTLTSKSIQLAGRVVNARSQIVPQALVVVFPTDRTLWSKFGLVPTWIRIVVSSNRGDFSVAGLRAGDYFVAGLVDAGSGLWSEPFFSSLAPRSARVTLGWGQSAKVDAPLVTGVK